MSPVGLSRIDLRLLAVFLDVVDHEGVSAAALATNSSLSSVTRDLAALEDRLGVRLCQRGRGGFSLTSEGEEVYRAARQLLDDVRGFEAKIAATRSTRPGALEIGLIDNMLGNPDCQIAQVLNDLHRKMPGLHLRVSVHPVTAIEVMVRERRLDIGFTGLAGDLTPLRYVHAYDERHACYISRNCPAFEAVRAWRPGQEGVTIPYVIRTFPSTRFQAFERSMPFRVTAIGGSLEGVLAGVISGFGAGLLPVHAARMHEGLVALDYPAGGLRVPFSIVVRRDAETRPEIAAFLKFHARRAAQA
jgi:DNA-binding transcriptional LysR family regulator